MRLIAFIAASVCLLSACGSPQISNSETLRQHAYDLASASNLTPESAIDAAQSILDSAVKNELNFYAPIHFAQASDSLFEARRLLNNGGSLSKVVGHAYEVESVCTDAYNVKAIVSIALSDAVAQRATLRSLNAEGVLPHSYDDVMLTLEDLVKDVESGAIKKAKKRQKKVVLLMQQLEVDTVRQSNLGAAIAVMEKARAIGASEFAAKTYAEAQQAIALAAQKIEENYKDEKIAKEAGDVALVAARRTYNVAEEALNLVNMNAEEAEERVLFLESLLTKIRGGLKQEGEEGASIGDQIESIVAAAKRLYQAVLRPTSSFSGESEEVEDELSIVSEEVMMGETVESKAESETETAASEDDAKPSVRKKIMFR